ncbi:hypothetical protein H113_04569 [Trichophyton rubrum MR1459]|uniref:DUF2306 domain-containing protein n=3 Tax=Trichophyton rubrum TaxID=5551 RepID=F2SMZ4_TRIRC|nr:uncharacterized protein TERG_04307 [Trichophyton rubrum CBS 118892]EGD88055.2 hypothetical protein TERG_04307 [Trichophyton rubrum CBS 118892]EZF95022.1 hypothetical protein H113_04569 [Trichophyton rubrum MR1459]EZG16485.1 hypothetical protein H107_04660 [Trichophyton rubrum CBS 202.88]
MFHLNEIFKDTSFRRCRMPLITILERLRHLQQQPSCGIVTAINNGYKALFMSSTFSMTIRKNIPATIEHWSGLSLQNFIMSKIQLASFWHRLIGAVGFRKSYNFILFFIFAGGLLGFTLSRLQYLDINRFRRSSIPGEWYYYQQDLYKTGIMLHLGAILPCSLLIVLQFIPIIRYKATLFHRLNGYVIMLLFMISNAGVIIIIPHAFGGDPATRFSHGLLVLVSTISIIIAYINIRRKQIEQHRAWMLRAMFYMGSIITMRPLIEISSPIFRSIAYKFYVSWPCDQIDFTWKFYNISVPYTSAYPICNATIYPWLGNIERYAPVRADTGSPDPAAIGASIQLQSALAGSIATFLHFVGIELYLRLTPREHEQLRNVSYELQAAAKYINPGSAGLVVQKIGDANPWIPQQETNAEDN